jgi:hypothetical protein
LEKYRETINSKRNSKSKVSVKNDFKLATLFKAPKIKKWKEITYAQIAVNLKKIFKTNNEKSFNKNKVFISEYIIMLNDLVRLSLLLMQKKSKKYDFLSYDTATEELIKNLGYIGLTPSYMKYKYGIMGYEFCKSLKKEYPSSRLLLGTSGIDCRCHDFKDKPPEQSYDFQGKPLVQIDWGIAGTTKEGWLDIAVILNEKIRMGVQLQNGKYRRFICKIGKTKIRENAESIANSLKQKDIFFKNNYEKKFGTFGDEFRYQYLRAVDAPKIINDKGNIIPGKTYDEILKHIKQDLKKAIQARKELKI